ncbi:hypothetical protein NDU88_010364 [Pleurodeles waltl]|uniref:Uncharacterized protein n=1 Tax=Pleurodeles waltl TaxID=8319 RepID=A0AAV7QXA1_PLEWA|nr:hypothetical protein NDU88_010364 [Pleurodeles waltl]
MWEGEKKYRQEGVESQMEKKQGQEEEEEKKQNDGPRLKRVEREENRSGSCSPYSAPFPSHLLPFFTSRPLPLVPHPVPGVATLLLKRGGSYAKLPGVSGLHQGFPSAPTPALFRSSGERLLRLWCRCPLESSILLQSNTPGPSTSYSRRTPRKGEEASF